MIYFVYCISINNKPIYVGSTNEVITRIKYHVMGAVNKKPATDMHYILNEEISVGNIPEVSILDIINHSDPCKCKAMALNSEESFIKSISSTYKLYNKSYNKKPKRFIINNFIVFNGFEKKLIKRLFYIENRDFFKKVHETLGSNTK